MILVVTENVEATRSVRDKEVKKKKKEGRGGEIDIFFRR